MCGLGRGISSTGRLNPEGVALALVNLRRFVAFARAIAVDHLAVLATAAVRDASDGAAFAAEVERQCRVQVKIIDGAEEARLSAAGVLAGIPDADGIVADLGGGSVEVICVGPGTLSAGGAGQIGEGISLPLGPLRLAEFGDRAKVLSETVERALAGVSVLRAAAGRKVVFGRRSSARHRPAAYGAHAISAPHHSPVHDFPKGGRRFPRHHRPAVTQIAREDHHDLAQAPRRSAARGIGSAQADHARGTAKRRLFRSWPAGRLCIWAHSRRGADPRIR